LYVCLVDFAKAFDTAQRPLLWDALMHLGLSGKFLSTLQCLYSAVRMRVKLHGKTGDVFESLLGVKQGDPLSPVLFGAFIEVLPAFLCVVNELSAQGHDMLSQCPDVDGLALFYMLFADDLTLLSRCPARLQCLLASLQYYCTVFGMSVNVQKTEVIVFGPAPAVAQATATAAVSPFTYDGAPIRLVSSARYLGMIFDSDGTVRTAERSLRAAATRARFALQRSITRLGPLPPTTQLRLFDTLVRPVLMYGAQVWGAEYLKLPPPRPPDPPEGARPPTLAPRGLLDTVVYDFLRFVSGTGRTAPSWVLLQDFSVLPLQSHLAAYVFRMWNSLRGEDHRGSAAGRAARADLRLMLRGSKRCWSYHTCKFLSDLSTYMPTACLVAPPHSLPFTSTQTPFPVDAFDYWWALLVCVHDIKLAVADFWRARTLSHISHNPRERAHLPMYAAYVSWVGLPPTLSQHAHLSCRLSRSAHVCLMRFRLGCWHFLAANRERILPSTARRPRSSRICDRCPCGTVDDELHALFECAALAPLRARFPDLFPPGAPFTDEHARALINHRLQLRVADFLLLVYRHCNPPQNA
jgi:hypothetical protein